jgi:hypothetical protein
MDTVRDFVVEHLADDGLTVQIVADLVRIPHRLTQQPLHPLR